MSEKETVNIYPIIKSQKYVKFLCKNCNSINKIKQLGKMTIYHSNCLRGSTDTTSHPCRACFISDNTYYDCPVCNNRQTIEISDSNPYY